MTPEAVDAMTKAAEAATYAVERIRRMSATLHAVEVSGDFCIMSEENAQTPFGYARSKIAIQAATKKQVAEIVAADLRGQLAELEIAAAQHSILQRPDAPAITEDAR